MGLLSALTSIPAGRVWAHNRRVSSRCRLHEILMMIDRIAEPWGSRTPYGRGDPWPR
jgi:hypothetical protein